MDHHHDRKYKLIPDTFLSLQYSKYSTKTSTTRSCTCG